MYQSTADQIIRDCCGLSSGTLASLTNQTTYTALDEIHRRFIQFTIAALSSSPKEFKNWQEAWSQYWKKEIER